MFVALLRQRGKRLLGGARAVGYGIFRSRIDDLVDACLLFTMFGYFFLYLLFCHAGGAGFVNQFLRDLCTYGNRYQQKEESNDTFCQKP